jgi:hypothetical protein
MNQVIEQPINGLPSFPFHSMVWLVMAVVVGLMGCGQKSADSAGGDTTPPATVTDLRIVTIGTTAVTLQWTAPGDDDSVGQVIDYDIRFSSNAITSGTFSQATPTTGQPFALPAGSAQFFMAGGLTPGSRYYFALRAADDQDNWSGISNCVAAFCLADQVVPFPDTAFDRIIRERIGKSSGDIYKSDIDSLEDLTAQNAGIVNLNGLREFVNLRRCDLTRNDIEFLVQLQNLAGLTSLAVVDNDVVDLTPLAGLTNLQSLALGFNPLTDISPLAGLTDMRTLDLSNLPVKNYAAVGNMTKLETLLLASDSLDDLTFLTPLTKLIALNIGGAFTDLSPMEGLASLSDLRIASTPVADLGPLASLTNLQYLRLTNNEIVDIRPLVDNPGLGSGDVVDLTGNPLSAESINTYIPALQARGVTVSY